MTRPKGEANNVSNRERAEKIATEWQKTYGCRDGMMSLRGEIERAIDEAEERGRREKWEIVQESAWIEGQKEMRERAERYIEARTYLKREERELIKREIRSLPVEGEE